MTSHAIQRHMIPMSAHFRHSVVVSYAFPADLLQTLLPSGLIVDAVGDLGFAAVAVVQADAMRPTGLPRVLGRDYLLAGYRVFCRFTTPEGRRLRGLHILRSDASAISMVVAGNLLTRYHYRHSRMTLREDGRLLRIRIASTDGLGDLDLTADLAGPLDLPGGSPFADLRAARRFAGPLPFTFDAEPESNSIVVVEGVRSSWDPRPVSAAVDRATFFDDARFRGVRPILAGAFHVADVDFRWRRGVRMRLPGAA